MNLSLCYRPAPMSPAKKPTKPRTGSKSTAKKATPKKTSRTTSGKKTASRSTAKKSTAKKSTARKTAAKKTTAKKSTAKKPTAKKTTAKKTAKTPAKKTATSGTKKTVAKAPVKKAVAEQAPAAPAKPVKKPLIRRVQPKPPPPKKVRPAKLSPEDLDRIKTTLEGERTDLERQLDDLQGASFQGSQSDLTGEVGLDEDFADAGTATFDRERDLSIRNNIRDLIDQINRALGRIEEGAYGTCERCGNPIDASRLKALPHASLCLDCKRREERVR